MEARGKEAQEYMNAFLKYLLHECDYRGIFVTWNLTLFWKKISLKREHTLFFKNAKIKNSFRQLWKSFAIKISPEVSNNIPLPLLTFIGYLSRAFCSLVTLRNVILFLALNIFHFVIVEFRFPAQVHMTGIICTQRSFPLPDHPV